MLAIIDYDAGNLRSVEKALEFLNIKAVITRDKNTILKADKVILPGVGNFGDCMDKLHKYDLEDTIKEVVDKKTPFLGICLGMQLLFNESEEAPNYKGLCLLEGSIVRFTDEINLKIPQIGWNSIGLHNNGALFKGINDDAYVYFVHSYYLKAKEENIVKATCEYGVTVHASVQKDNIFGCQFHPEKSGEIGLKILKNFGEV